MKILILSLFLLSSFGAFAKCKVYGISDSPQKLTCQFPEMEVRLSCRWNTYYLNSEKVNLAFHMEVEEGAVPLVFKTKSGVTLTVLPEDQILAEYTDGKVWAEGTCRR